MHEHVDEIFRVEYARVVASVLRLVRDIDTAEEVVQEAFAQALARWPATGAPERPGAWLLTTARRRALDRLRSARRADARAGAIAYEVALGAPGEPEVVDPQTIPDDRLRLVFTCCHPALPAESRVALTLRLVGGLSTVEIARAFLVAERTIAQRLVRAKRTIRERGLTYEVPAGDELAARLPAVLSVVYLIFNEGYAAHTGDALVRDDLCTEAIRLGGMLAELIPGEPEVLGLLALMELQASRVGARADADGNLVLLADQDRARWDRARIARALSCLDAAGPIERAPPRRGQEPRARALGRARRGPARERLRECLLHDLFGHVDVAHEAQHRRDDARVLDAEDLVDVLVHAAIVLPALTSARRAARPRSRPRRRAPSLPTPAPPRARRTPAGRSRPAPPSSPRTGRR